MARKHTTKIDRRLDLPPGLEDLEYEIEDDLTAYDTEEDESESPDYDLGDAYEETSGESELFPPDYITIVSQTVRTLPGGGQVVDVVLDLPDPEEGYKYNIRSTVK